MGKGSLVEQSTPAEPGRARSLDSRKVGPYSLEELLKSNMGWLRGWLAARLGGQHRQDVDDLCQEVFLRALGGAHRLRRPDRFPGWLYRVASNVLRDHVRQSARSRRTRSSLADDVEDPRDVTARVELDDEVQDALEKVLRLPRRYRDAMILRHVEDLSYAEIGRILGISENAVQVRIFRARQMLRRASSVAGPGASRATVSLPGVPPWRLGIGTRGDAEALVVPGGGTETP